MLTNFCCFLSVSPLTWTTFCEKYGSGILIHCTKIICCASLEGIKGQPPRASKWPKMLIWYNFDQFLLFFLFLHQYELHFVKKCGQGITLQHPAKIPCCDSQERIKGKPLGASKWPKMVIWHSFYHFLLFLLCFSTNTTFGEKMWLMHPPPTLF